MAGSDRALDDLLRDSVTAPYIIKVHDIKTSDAVEVTTASGSSSTPTCEQVDFRVEEASRADQQEIEVANMWFQTRLLKDDDLRSAGVKPAPAARGQNTWYSHVHARLLDRIDFEATPTRSIATQIDPTRS